jgi:enterochelin esterase-like enzyme
MRTVEIIIDGHTSSSPADLGTTLHEFLCDQGIQVGELLFDPQGKPVSTQFTLAHAVHGQHLTQKGEVPAAVAALTVDEVLATTV